MKRILVCIWGLAPLFLHAQTLTVLDRESGAPIDLVDIISENPRAYASTNKKGEANFASFVGFDEIVIRKLGYEKQVRSYDEIAAEGFLIRLSKSSLSLDAVVVSATRWREPSDKIPAKVVAISPEEVNLQNPQTAADLLAVSGKVYIQKSQQGGGSPMIRGFAANRLIYTVDGVRMNNAIFRGGNIQNVINLDPFAIESAEVVFGPGSVIYGSDAIGGVMSFQTLTPQMSQSDDPLVTGKAVARFSSANKENSGHFDVNLGWRKWALVTSFSAWDYDHLRQGSHGPDDYLKPYFVQRVDSVDRVVTQDDPRLQVPSAYSQVNLMQKVRFKPSEVWDFEYGFHFSETSPYGRYDRHNRRRNGTARYAEWDYGPQKWMMNNLKVSNSRRTVLYDEWDFRIAHQRFEESRIDRSLNSNSRSISEEGVDAFSVNMDFLKSFSKRHTLFYGVEYVLNDVSSTGSITDISNGEVSPDASRYPQAQWQSAALYMNDEYLLSDALSLRGGLRLNWFSLEADFRDNLPYFPLPFEEASLSDQSLTGSLGAVYRPNKNWALTSNFGTAFRAPNVDDIGKVFDSEPGAVTVPNPNLSAEYAYNLDVGIAHVFSERVKLDVTTYYTLLNNALVRRNFSLNGQDSLLYLGELSRVQAIQNAADANVYGLQAGIEIKFTQELSFTGDINWQVGEEILDDGSKSPSRHAAPLFGSSRLNYNRGKVQLQAYVLFQEERRAEDLAFEERAKDEIYAQDENGLNYAPAWYTLNVKAMVQLSEQLFLSTGLENITDQRYRPYSSGISGAGRNFILSLRAQF